MPEIIDIEEKGIFFAADLNCAVFIGGYVYVMEDMTQKPPKLTYIEILKKMKNRASCTTFLFSGMLYLMYGHGFHRSGSKPYTFHRLLRVMLA
jgi:hypothetical protein